MLSRQTHFNILIHFPEFSKYFHQNTLNCVITGEGWVPWSLNSVWKTHGKESCFSEFLALFFYISSWKHQRRFHVFHMYKCLYKRCCPDTPDKWIPLEFNHRISEHRSSFLKNFCYDLCSCLQYISSHVYIDTSSH